jgi:hypothetical protein
MVYAKTPTYVLSKKQLKKIAKLSLEFCILNFGMNNKKRTPLGLTITHDVSDGFFGMYYPEINQIEVYPDACYTIGRFTSTIIHEYIHTLQKQNIRAYSKLLKEYGYYNHPYEVEARSYEKKFNRKLLQYLRDNW